MLSVLKANFRIICLAGCFFILMQSIGFAKQLKYKGVIQVNRLNIRSGPSLKSAVVTKVNKNDMVDVLQKKPATGSWVKISYKGKKGYIRNRPEYIKISSAEKIKQAALQKKQQREAHKAKKKVLEKKIVNQEEMVKIFSKKETEIIESLDQIDYNLNKARIEVSALSVQNKKLGKRIRVLTKDREKLAAQIRVNQAYAGLRLKAIYKMNMLGRLDAAGLPSSVFDFFLKQNAMKRIIASDVEVLETQQESLERFNQVEAALKREVRSKTALEKRLKNQIRISKKETLKKEMILKEIRKKKKLSLAAVESLKNAAVQLDNQMRSLQAGKMPNFNQSSFPNYKGRLIFPVKGKIISTYGPSTTGDYKSYTFQKGIDIKVERGEPVKAVFKGVVMFASWLKGYGNLMIINHGDNYYTLYAHVEEIFKSKDEQVDTGEVIATAGDTGSIKGMCLHFEVRHHGKPVNPMKWLRKGA